MIVFTDETDSAMNGPNPFKETALYWSFAGVAVTGLLIGLRFRAPAMIAASAMILVVAIAVFGADGSIGRADFVLTVCLVITLQIAYLGGVGLATVWRRITEPK